MIRQSFRKADMVLNNEEGRLLESGVDGGDGLMLQSIHM
jgi:hypothetical protein